MRTIPIIAGAALTLLIAGATMAATPAPTALPAPTKAPATTPAGGSSSSGAPSVAGTSSTKTSTATTATSANSWSATIRPLNETTGSAMLVKNADGTGTLTLTMHGLRADQPWSVDVDGGTAATPLERAADEIASRSGQGVEKVSSDTVRISLTKAEMADFLAARTAHGVVVLVSDGANRSAAEFTG